jgi:phosphoglucomutase
MSESPADRAGQPAQPQDLVDVAHLVTAYYTGEPDPSDPGQRVTFGTSGHRGSSLNNAFNEAHILATTQAICDYRRSQGYDGPLFLGRDTHGLSEPAWATALEVLVANDVDVLVDDRDGYTPTPAVSHAILRANHGRKSGPADGIVVTPSHNPPSDGGFKYNPPHGGPAGSDATSWIADAANVYIEQGIGGLRRLPFAKARAAASSYDFLGSYIDDLPNVVDIAKIKEVGVRIGADPLGGASVGYWGEIADRHGLDLTVVNPLVDATWRFMTLDWDGKIRMDCSSPSAMASLIEQKDAYQIATGNDADADRHGIVTPDGGLMNPNHYLAVAISYLYGGARPSWPDKAAIGKTLVSSSMIDRVAELVGRRLTEVPVGFKWFVPGLLDGSIAFGGEESAGASFLRFDGTVWTTDKDGLILALLASEILATTGKSPSEHYAGLVDRFGDPAYARVDAAADRDQKAKLAALTPDDVTADSLAGEEITAKLTEAPGNGAKVGGLKVTTENAWFAARPSGTEDVYKIYAESFRGPEHLEEVQEAAREVVSAALGS